MLDHARGKRPLVDSRPKHIKKRLDNLDGLAHGMNWKGLLLMNVPTLVTLLLVLVVQHTQNHHNDAVQVKLDEPIRAVDGASNVMVNLDNLPPETLAKVKAQYEALGEQERAQDGPSLEDRPESAPQS